MRRTVHSLGHALRGLAHAFRHERNLSLFLLLHASLTLFIAALSHHPAGVAVPLIILSFFGAFFLVIELLNTSIERLADTFDDTEKKRHAGHYHPGIKITKDVASGASLIALCIYGVIAIMLIVTIVRFPML